MKYQRDLVRFNGTDIPALVESIDRKFSTIAEAFYDVGSDLIKLQEAFKELPAKDRKAEGNWTEFLKKMWGIAPNTATQFMQAKVAMDNLKSVAIATKNLPTHESQIRPLAKADLNENPELQVTIWTAALEAAGDAPPTAKIVKEMVDKFTKDVKKEEEGDGNKEPNDEHVFGLSFTKEEREVAAEFVKIAYRNLAKKYHPDHGGDPEKMKILNGLVKQMRSAFDLDFTTN